MTDLPACCRAPAGAEPAHELYAAYNRSGETGTEGLNYAGKPCPTWDQLPANVKRKWRAVAIQALNIQIEERERRG